jgi:hypothetical protein
MSQPSDAGKHDTWADCTAQVPPSGSSQGRSQKSDRGRSWPGGLHRVGRIDLAEQPADVRGGLVGAVGDRAVPAAAAR